MISQPTIVRQFLVTAGTSLYSSVGTRVWLDLPPQSSVWSNDAPALIVNAQGGDAHRSGAAWSATVTVKAYGGDGTRGTAETVAHLVYDRLHGASGSVTEGRLESAFLIDGPTLTVEPDSGYPVAISRYRVYTQEN